MARSEDAVSDRIARLDSWAQRLGEGFGISYTSFELSPLPPLPTGSNNWALAAATLRELTHRAERVSLERRSGRWGLYFTRDPAALAQDRRAEAAPIRDAPLDVRERFLQRSEQFFRAYLIMCADRLGRMNTSVTQADHTLKLLEAVRLE
jgi:hypothetical protein